MTTQTPSERDPLALTLEGGKWQELADVAYAWDHESRSGGPLQDLAALTDFLVETFRPAPGAKLLGDDFPRHALAHFAETLRQKVAALQVRCERCAPAVVCEDCARDINRRFAGGVSHQLGMQFVRQPNGLLRLEPILDADGNALDPDAYALELAREAGAMPDADGSADPRPRGRRPADDGLPF
jgi:hypothetical protein